MINVIKKLFILFWFLVFSFYTGITTLIYSFTIYPLLEKPYNATEWIDGDPIQRGYMVDSLLATKHKFRSFDKNKLTNQLGEPDTDRGKSMCYDIGPLEGRFGFMAFPYRLCISLKDNLFENFYITD